MIIKVYTVTSVNSRPLTHRHAMTFGTTGYKISLPEHLIHDLSSLLK